MFNNMKENQTAVDEDQNIFFNIFLLITRNRSLYENFCKNKIISEITIVKFNRFLNYPTE